MPRRLHAELPLDDDARLYVGEDGGRVLAQRGRPPTYATDDAGFDLVIVVRTQEGFASVDADGWRWDFTEPLGPFTRVTSPGARVTQVRGWLRGDRARLVGLRSDDRRLLTSDDLGRTWRPTPGPDDTFIADVETCPSGRGMALGFPEQLYRTSDFGETWTRWPSPVRGVHSIDQLDDECPVARKRDEQVTFDGRVLGAHCATLHLDVFRPCDASLSSRPTALRWDAAWNFAGVNPDDYERRGDLSCSDRGWTFQADSFEDRSTSDRTMTREGPWTESTPWRNTPALADCDDLLDADGTADALWLACLKRPDQLRLFFRDRGLWQTVPPPPDEFEWDARRRDFLVGVSGAEAGKPRRPTVVVWTPSDRGPPALRGTPSGDWERTSLPRGLVDVVPTAGRTELVGLSRNPRTGDTSLHTSSDGGRHFESRPLGRAPFDVRSLSVDDDGAWSVLTLDPTNPSDGPRWVMAFSGNQNWYVLPPPEGTLLAGRFGRRAIAVGHRTLETTDGGRRWVDVGPAPPLTDAERRLGPVRCHAHGCELWGWRRVGWGAPSAPLVRRPPAPASPSSPSLPDHCDPSGPSAVVPMRDDPTPVLLPDTGFDWIALGHRPELDGGVTVLLGAAEDAPRVREVQLLPPASPRETRTEQSTWITHEGAATTRWRTGGRSLEVAWLHVQDPTPRRAVLEWSELGEDDGTIRDAVTFVEDGIVLPLQDQVWWVSESKRQRLDPDWAGGGKRWTVLGGHPTQLWPPAGGVLAAGPPEGPHRDTLVLTPFWEPIRWHGRSAVLTTAKTADSPQGWSWILPLRETGPLVDEAIRIPSVLGAQSMAPAEWVVTPTGRRWHFVYDQNYGGGGRVSIARCR